MLKPGMFISDRYEIVEKVGSGGMADVYKARCHRLNRFVAIKVLKAEFSDDKSFVLKFRAEAQSAAGLSHPNIVNVYDVGDDDGLYYIVMELVEGITLKSFIERKGKLEVKEAVGIAIQIAQGLEAAHDNHIIHRDIKPQNIIISREGKVKVTDFGIAKAASTNTINSNAMGSVHYISPEQARGGYIDERSDIYSLGVTLYEMLSGMLPFAGENTVSVALLHIQGEAMPLREVDPTIPVSLEKIVGKCMEKKPERRYPSAAELIADLKRSIINPAGDFVKVVAPIVDNSPTISISEDEIKTIKNAVRSTDRLPIEEVQAETDLDTLEDEEEDEDDTIASKMNKIVIIITAVVGVIFLIVLFVLGNKLFNFFGKSGGLLPTTPSPEVESSIEPTIEPTETPGMIKVDDVVGVLLKDAVKQLEDAGFVVNYTEESSDEFQKDYVISQSVTGEAVAGTKIKLVVSTGAETFKLRDVYGLSVEEARTLLNDQGLIYEHSYEYSNTVAKDFVIRTTPERGSAVLKNDKVTIIVSRGKETKMVNVPNLLGLTEEEAKKALADKGLSVGNKFVSNSKQYAEGLVMEQSVANGKQVAEGTYVDITISQGPAATATPKPTPIPDKTEATPPASPTPPAN